MKKQFEILDSQRSYDGFLQMDSYRIKHQSFHGGWCAEIKRERIEGLNAVSVLPYDPVLDQIVLIEQFRVGAVGAIDEPWLLETIGGYRGEGESAEAVARRESMEEANLELQELVHIGDFFVSPGISSERIALYCASVDSSKAGGIYGLAHEGEEMQVVVLSAEKAKQELFKRINSTSGIIAMQWFMAHQNTLRNRWR